MVLPPSSFLACLHHERECAQQQCLKSQEGGSRGWFLRGAVKIDVEPAGRARMICVVLKSNIDKYQCNETQLLTEAIFD